jgi:phage-related protein (TIGR01555 family)
MAKNKHKKQNNVVNNGLASALDLPCANENIPLNNPYNANLLFTQSYQYLITQNWIPLTNAYNKNSFLQTAVNQMVEDAFRNDGLIIDSKTLSTDELEKLRTTMKDEGDIDEIIDCIRWGRLYGGGVLIANTEQDYSLPLDEKQLKGKKLKFLATNRWQCLPNGVSPYIAESFVLTDSLNQSSIESLKHGANVDASRVAIFTGRKSPYMTSAILQGWNASIFEGILEPINNLLGAFNVTLELLSEAKIDIFKIAGLSNLLMSPEGERQVRKRIQIATENKNYKGSLAMDSEDEYEQKQISFGGIPDLLNQMMYIFAGYLRYPVSKLFGKGSSGFSSGDDDIENYNGNVDSDIRTPAKKLIKWVVDLRCLQLFGRTLPDFEVKWKPLKVLSEKEQAEINSRRLADYLQLADRNIMSKQMVAQKLTEDGYILFSEDEVKSIDDDFVPEKYNKAEDLLVD